MHIWTQAPWWSTKNAWLGIKCPGLTFWVIAVFKPCYLMQIISQFQAQHIMIPIKYTFSLVMKWHTFPRGLKLAHMGWKKSCSTCRKHRFIYCTESYKNSYTVCLSHQNYIRVQLEKNANILERRWKWKKVKEPCNRKQGMEHPLSTYCVPALVPPCEG